MLREYLAAAFQTWAAERAARGWREFWRLKRLGIRWQLRGVQKIGADIELRGPVIIRSRGTIEIGNRVFFDSCWHKPIYISVPCANARLVIEEAAYINYGAEISLLKEVVIGAYSMISIDCLIYDTDWHNLDGQDGSEIPAAPTRIGRGAWLGARVTVLKGVTIGDNTVVAANSVVTRDLPDGVLAAGNPARVVRRIERRRWDADSMQPV